MFREHLNAGRFCEAFVLVERVMTELKDVPEGAAAYERAQAVERAAARGQHDWACILTNPSIPLTLKTELTEEIHDQAIRAAGKRP